MAFPVYSPQNLSLPPIRQLPEDVRNPLGSLGQIIGEIAQAQKQRKLDELNLRKAQMSLADVERQRADEAAMRSALSAPMAEEMPAATSPRIGPPVMEPTTNAQRVQEYASRLMKMGRVKEATDLLEVLPKLAPKTPSGMTFEQRKQLQDEKYGHMGALQKDRLIAIEDRMEMLQEERAANRIDDQSFRRGMAALQFSYQQALQQSGANLRQRPMTTVNVNGKALQGLVNPDGSIDLMTVNQPGTSALPAEPVAGEGYTGPIPEPDPSAPTPVPFPTPDGSPAPAISVDLPARLDAQPGQPLYAEKPTKVGEKKISDSIQRRYEAGTKVFSQVQPQYRSMFNMLDEVISGKAPSATRSEMIRVLRSKLLDPSTGVREGEVFRYAQLQSLGDRVNNWARQFENAQDFTPAQAAQVKREMENFYNEIQNFFREEENYYRAQAEAQGLQFIPRGGAGKKSYKRVINGIEVTVEED